MGGGRGWTKAMGEDVTLDNGLVQSQSGKTEKEGGGKRGSQTEKKK